MLEWLQMQAVAQKLTNRVPGGLRARDLDEPWRTLFRRVEPAEDPAMFGRALWKATVGLEDRNALVDAVLEVLPSILPTIPSLDKMAADLPPIEWVWPGWLPRGMLSLLGAAPGAGKSLVALDLARRVIHREPFPDSARRADALEDASRAETATFPGGNVVFVDAEAVPQIQNERASAWGMDRSKLYLMLPKDQYGLIDFNDTADQDRLLEMVFELQPHLLVVDSLSSITLKGENNVEDVRAVLSFLSAVAREFDLALLLIHHLRKRGKALPMMDLVTADDFRGSSHIIAMARSVLALSIIQDGPEPDRNGPRRLEVVKTNLCRYPPALGVRFEDNGQAAPEIRYGEVPKPHREPTKAEACANWLLELLQEVGEPMQPKEVIELGKEVGFKQATIYRARKELEGTVGNTAGKKVRRNSWEHVG